MNDDDVVFLNINHGDDDDNTVFQTEEDRKRLEQDIQQMDEDDSDYEITEQMHSSRPYWQQVFG